MGKTALDDVQDVVNKYFDVDWQVKSFTERNKKYGWGKKFKVSDYRDKERNIFITNVEPEIKKLKEIPTEEDGGFTLNLDGTVYDKGGLAVPLESMKVIKNGEETAKLDLEDVTPESVKDFIDKNQDKIGSDIVKPGGYKFKGEDKASIDLNIVGNKKYIDVILEFGRLAGQESIFDLDTFEYHKTGSDGKNPKSFTAAQFREIAQSLSEGKLPQAVQAQKSMPKRVDKSATEQEKKAEERKQEFEKMQSPPRTDAPEEIAWDQPLPTGFKEDPNFKLSDLNNAMGLRNITRELVKNLGLTEGAQVRVGHVKDFAKKARGLFFLDSGIVRVGNIADLNTMTHELGHYIDGILFDLRGTISGTKYRDVVRADRIQNPTTRDAELQKLRTKYGDNIVAGVLQRVTLRKELLGFLAKSNYPKRQQKTTEGIAEFVRNYVVDPTVASTEMPNFNAWFEKVLDEAPQIKEALDVTRKNFKEFNEQDLRVKYEGRISREKEDNSFLAGIMKLNKNKVIYSLLNNLKYGELVQGLWNEAMGGKGPSEKDPFLSLKGMLGIDGRVHQWLYYHPYKKSGGDITINKNVDGLLKILKPIIGTDKYKAYEGYLVAKRDLESFDNNRPELAMQKDRAEAEKTVELYEKQFGKKELEDFQKRLQDFTDALMDFYEASGKLSAEDRKNIRDMNRYYVPFRRVFEEYELTGKMPTMSKGMLASSATPVKSRTGSQYERPITSPFEAMIENTYSIINAAERNITNRNMVDALLEIQKYALKNGESRGIIQEIKGTNIKPYIDSKTKTVRFGFSGQAPKGRIITVWDNGKARYYEVAPEYFDTLYQNESKVNEIVRVLSIPSRWLQAGAVVYDPTFAFRNVPRDQMSAWFYSKYGYAPTDFIRGISSALKKDDVFQKWLASGADQSFLVASDKMLSREYVEGNIGSLLQKKWKIYSKNPLAFLQDFSRASEMGTRIGSFKNAYKKTGDVYKAMQESRDIAADYGIKGAAMRQILPLYPFLNARSQHVRMTANLLKNPAKMLMMGLAVTAPAIINWLVNNQDDESQKLYQSLPTWRRVGLWNVRIPGTDRYFPIPKGFLGVAFGSSVEAFLDYMVKDDPRVIEQIPTTLFKELSPVGNISEIVPLVVRPEIEHWANKKGFTGRPIVPEVYTDLKPEQQFFESTPEIYKKIAETAGISPLIMEHYVNSYFGGAGRGVVTIVDDALQTLGVVEMKPEDRFTRLSKLPVFKAILTERPIGSYSSYLQDFFGVLDEMSSVNKQVNGYLAKDDTVRLEQFLKNPKNDAMYKFYIANETSINHFRTILQQNRETKYAIMKDDNLSAKEKDQSIRNLEDVVQSLSLRFKDAYDKKEFFDIGKEASDLLEQARAKRKDDQSVIQRQKNLYNPYWLNVKEKDQKMYDLIRDYDMFQNLSMPSKEKSMDEEDFRIYKERAVDNYVKAIKSEIGTDKKKLEALRAKVVSPPSAEKEQTALDAKLNALWVKAKAEAEKMGGRK